ncbi:MAG: MBL fold metallo-hydrolase RNA specificity domain-containing protein [Saccharofermentanales bacterium]
MNLSFFGAAKEVTGSCFQLDVNGKQMIIDCGMQQGQDEKDNQHLSFRSSDIDAVLLTHAHIDHSGRLPLMVKDGFKGKIYATRATCDLIAIMLLDSAHIQEMDAEWDNRKGIRAGHEIAEPLYTVQDVEETLRFLVPCNYEDDLTPLEGVRVRFTDAGHLLGSSSIQIWLNENNITKKIVFSGDIGNKGQPIIRDPQYIKEADYVVMESTYGDRDHEHVGNYTDDLAKIIDDTMKNGGNVIIPAFSVGRTQELLYFIREIKERNLVKSVPDFPVYVDSPLSSQATKIYDGDLKGYADEETIQLLKSGFRPLDFAGLNTTESTEESKALNQDTIPKIIISSSGMCNAGRIRHHLKHNLWRPECSVVFVGFQANGTLGRLIVDGAPKVKIFGEEIIVRAQIINYRGLSAHADQTGLLEWIHSYTPKPQKVFIVHGETAVCDIFADILKNEQYQVMAPNFETVYDLANDKVVNEGVEPEKIRAEIITAKPEPVHLWKHTPAVSNAYLRLLEAGELLLESIKSNKNGESRDLARFTNQVLDLANKWDRK